MNAATKNLEDDHVHILRLIGVMDLIIGTELPDVKHLEAIVEIIRNYADGLHHAKEENIFFPLIAGKGFSLTQGPVAVMLHEHVTGREYVKGMASGIALYKDGDKQALKEIYTNMAGYAELLQNHIGKENNILFRMADRVLSDKDHEELVRKFDEAMKSSASKNTSEYYIGKIDELASVYGG